jgi:hypothetical protein
MPSISAKKITDSICPSTAARNGLSGTISISSSRPVAGGSAVVIAAARSAAPSASRARSSGDVPSPGRRRLTAASPRTTEMPETTTV